MRLLVAALTLAHCVAQAQASDDRPTYTRDVLPIIQQHCQDCHRPGQVGPMSLMNYSETRPWAKAIRESVTSRVMPPFHANAPLGLFVNDPRLTDAEIDTIARWVDAGAPQGDIKDAPPPVKWPAPDWNYSPKPDLVLEFPEYTSKPINEDEEILLYSNVIFGNETWVQAFEFKTTDNSIVHHAGVVSVDNTFFVPDDLVIDSRDEHLDRFGGESNGGLPLFSQQSVFTWLPGQRFESRPQGYGMKIRAGNRLVIQTHIPPTDMAIPFKVSLGVWFVNGEMKIQPAQKLSFMSDLVVPAGDPNYVHRERRTFANDVQVHGFSIHMHLRGKSSQVVFHYPDGTREIAFDMPRYNFDWQRRYWLQEPKPVPAGTEVEFIAVWDNSEANPLNPDPTVDVPWGPKTTQEMFTGMVYASRERKHPLHVKHGAVVPAPSSD